MLDCDKVAADCRKRGLSRLIVFVANGKLCRFKPRLCLVQIDREVRNFEGLLAIR